MYREFYGLKSKPFSLHPDPAFFFASKQYASAQAILDYAVLHQEGIVVITGEAGCGKTTLVHHFLNKIGYQHSVGVISNPILLKEMPLHGILFAFGRRIPSRFEADLYTDLLSFLQIQQQAQRSTILIVDEAQNLAPGTLEALRMLTNPEPNSTAALQLILVGQPQLEQTLNLPELDHLSQRIVTHYHLHSLDKKETGHYIAYRLMKARGQRTIFTPAAVSRIHSGSDGIPRLINMICDTSLMYGYAENITRIDEDTVSQVIADRGIDTTRVKNSSVASDQSDMLSKIMDQETARLIFSNKLSAL
jgi:type II secretory pathway predicted ATPase ExeA